MLIDPRVNSLFLMVLLVYQLVSTMKCASKLRYLGAIDSSVWNARYYDVINDVVTGFTFT